jgi:hypothetical protein
MSESVTSSNSRISTERYLSTKLLNQQTPRLICYIFNNTENFGQILYLVFTMKMVGNNSILSQFPHFTLLSLFPEKLASTISMLSVSLFRMAEVIFTKLGIYNITSELI